MRGELDWIVMKCLEKDRDRRYETANGLAADVQRYLDDEPVEACPPSTWYRFRKLAKRRRGPLAVTAAGIVVLLMGVVALGISNYRVRQEQTRTRDQKDRARRQQLAEDRADEVRRGLERLKASNAALDLGRWFIEGRRWDDADVAFTNALRLRPDHAVAWRQRGDMYAGLGLWDLAAPDFAREFELRDPDATMPWYRHALLRLHLGDTTGYRRACRRWSVSRGRSKSLMPLSWSERSCWTANPLRTLSGSSGTRNVARTRTGGSGILSTSSASPSTAPGTTSRRCAG